MIEPLPTHNPAAAKKKKENGSYNQPMVNAEFTHRSSPLN
jgi:hypothetical protein